MASFTPFFFDVLIIVLLAVTTVYCWRLTRSLNLIRDAKGEMAQLIRQFSEATENARQSVDDLKISAKKVSEQLQAKVDKAGFLADDLTFLIDKANKIADTLERGLTGRANEYEREISSRVAPARAVMESRNKEPEIRVNPKESAPISSEKAGSEKSRSEAEKELIEAIRQAR